ncbi:MAG: hypothetical protein RL755_2017 [Pseudomonadota bacterium]|jgi:hypothetical protein
MNQLTDQEIDFLESHIPELAEAAAKQAYWQALASGNSVLIAENDSIIEVFPDGTRNLIEKIAPSVPVPLGKNKL